MVLLPIMTSTTKSSPDAITISVAQTVQHSFSNTKVVSFIPMNWKKTTLNGKSHRLACYHSTPFTLKPVEWFIDSLISNQLFNSELYTVKSHTPNLTSCLHLVLTVSTSISPDSHPATPMQSLKKCFFSLLLRLSHDWPSFIHPSRLTLRECAERWAFHCWSSLHSDCRSLRHG